MSNENEVVEVRSDLNEILKDKIGKAAVRVEEFGKAFNVLGKKVKELELNNNEKETENVL